ncbi:MAG: potassium transporter, partial [Gemmatimonadetes bacterium]|nr:potassium transporter [Gemmatimonadota bacterium]
MAISHSVESSDLGFGEVVASESGKRLLNRDGSFNVRRLGLGVFRSLSIYHHLITVSWPRFLGLIAVWYLVINIVFAAAFLACGPRALKGPDTVET